MGCKEMLNAQFEWAKKGKIGGGAEFPQHAKVYVTVTMHHPEEPAGGAHDVVWYANGPLELKTENGKSFLTGDVATWINNTKWITVKTGTTLNTVADVFPDTPHLKTRLTVDTEGSVSMQILVNGKPFLGRPAFTFQPICTEGLLTKVLVKDTWGGTQSITVSFTNGTMIMG
jgi:hypothetical protein